MRQFSACAAALVLCAAGCRPADTGQAAAEQIDEDTFNVLVVRTAFEQQARDAVVAERSIYGYHFDPGRTTLNALGERQVDILAAAYRDARNVEVNVAPGGSSAGQRAERIETVRQEFVARGLAADAVSLVAGRPGAPSGYVLRVLTEPARGDRGESDGSGSGDAGRSNRTSGGSGSGSSGRTGGSTGGSSGRSGSSSGGR